MNITCMYLSEVRSRVPPPTYPRLRSLRSFSLGLLRVSLFEAVSYCGSWRMGINPTPTLAQVASISYKSRSTLAQVASIPYKSRSTLAQVVSIPL